ncbi:MAG: flagellar export protein FliJ [Desulfovibrio sp.]|jgi:flagellar FliJ protein|nr:flagellar export protein FliJ [Desulfovibrio sp.]
MAFRFNMQRVLDYREQLEEEAKVRLARALQAQLEAKQRLESLEAQLREARKTARETLLRDAAERWLHEGYVKGLSGDVKAAALQVQMTGAMVDEARKLLTERSIDKKILDKLKVRKRDQYRHDERMREQHANDETATLRYKSPTF